MPAHRPPIGRVHCLSAMAVVGLLPWLWWWSGVTPARAAEAGPTATTNSNWWSFRRLERPAVPALEGSLAGWARNPVDRFIAARLEEKGLRPAAEAGRATLIRRLSFDLRGLPPTPAEVAAFVSDPDPLAYERLVDRWLASPHLGERWARHWLDLVHFGETHGYDKDQPRPNAWPYRDYVIRAFNEDRPYRRFVQEQLAGDVLFPDTRDGNEALGFISAGPWDLIGHAEVPETKIDGRIARHLDRDDMVATTLSTFASLTVHCAQCHAHKFDPITTEDYYGLQAVFAALDRADRKFDADPEVARRRRALQAREKDAKERLETLEKRLQERAGPELARAEAELKKLEDKSAGGRPAEFGWHSGIEPGPEAVKWVQVDLGRSETVAEVVLTGCWDDFNGIGAGFGFPVRFKVEASDDADFQSGVRLLVDRTGADIPNPGVTPQRFAVDRVAGRHVRVTATRLAARQNDYIAALAELEVRAPSGTNVAAGATVTAGDSIEAPPRWAKANLTDGRHPGSALSPVEVARLRERRETLRARAKVPAEEEERTRAGAELEQVRKELAGLPPPSVVYAGTVHQGGGAFRGTGPDGGRPRPIHVLARGDVQKPGKPAQPGAIEAVSRWSGLEARFELPAEAPEGARRVALANWLTHPANPLPWRSIVNRVWQHHFGRALAESPNDFGRMGQPPSHPELLDWLAAEFRDGPQSLKALHRLLVTSATYRQSSVAEGEGAGRDADNRWYGRQNRRRLEAEAVRDSLLAVAGRLDARMGGPSFRDFVIERPEHSPHYQYHLADPDSPEAHRRTVYRFAVRSKPQPWLTTLDCADPSMLVDRRNETITPLQALALLNNDLVLVMAGHLAARAEGMAGDLPGRVRSAFTLAMGRAPLAEELGLLVRHAEQHGLVPACRLIFNLNEFVFVD